MSSDGRDPELTTRVAELRLRLERIEQDAADLRKELGSIEASITDGTASKPGAVWVEDDVGPAITVISAENQSGTDSGEYPAEAEPVDGRDPLGQGPETSAEEYGLQIPPLSGPNDARQPDIEVPEVVVEGEVEGEGLAFSQSSPIGGVGGNYQGADGSEPPAAAVDLDVEEAVPPALTSEQETDGIGPTKKESPPNLELRIGAVWLNRVGLVMLVIALALISRYVHARLAPWHRVMVGFLLSGVLSLTGWWFRQRLRHFARPVMAGGIAVAFFTSFAAHFVAPMACIGLGASLALMFAATFSLLLCAERWRSEPTAGLGIFLGHVAAFVAGGSTHSFSVIAILFLSIAAVVLFLRQNWLPLNVFSVVAAFASHFLWALRSKPEGTPEQIFWHNLLFLSSYYIIFLAADLIYSERVSRLGTSAFSVAQRAAGRAIGPATLMLYATMTLWLFRTTGVYWDGLHWFLLPLAGVQIGVTIFQRSRNNPDHPLYATAAVLFVSLGLISLFDGLSLNLALAAEALLLLVASRVLDLWFLNSLAQAVLAVNFVHFWVSGAHIIKTWPAFVGALATSSVYFVKSRLMETWRPSAASPQGELTRVLVRWTESTSGTLTFIYAVAGAILVAYQCSEFFNSPWSALAITVAAAPIVILAVRVTSLPLMVAVILLWLAQLGQLRAFQWSPGPANASPNVWLVTQGGIIIMAALAWAAMLIGRKGGRTLNLGLGAAGLAIAASAVLAFSDIGHPVLMVPLWLVLPVILWVETAIDWSGYRSDSQELGGPVAACERFVLTAGPVLHPWVPVAAALVLWAAALAAFPLPSQSLTFLSCAIVVILVWTLWCERALLMLGLVGELALMAVSLISLGRGLPKNALVAWEIPFVAVLVAFGLLLWKARPDGDAKAFGHGLAALAIGMGTTALLILGGHYNFHPLALWLVHIAAIWYAVDLLDTWEKRAQPRKRTSIPKVPSFLTAALSVTNAAMLGWLFVRYFDTFSPALWAFFSVPLLLSILALVRRNRVPVAGAVGAVATHLVMVLFADTMAGLDPWIAWWVTVEATVVGFVLVTAGLRWRRVTPAAGGMLSVCLAVIAITLPLTTLSTSYSPYAAWLAIALALWVPFEKMRFRPKEGVSSVDRHDREWLNLQAVGGSVSIVLSAIMAFVVGRMTMLELSWRPAPLMVVMGLVVCFSIATVMRRSPTLAMAGGVLMFFAHWLLVFDIGITRTAVDYPLLGLALVLLTLVIGAAVERMTAGGKLEIHPAVVWLAYGPGFFVGFSFLGELGATYGESWRLPPQIILAVAALALAWGMRLSRLRFAALAGVWWVILFQTMTPLVTGERPTGMLHSGMIVILLILVAERISWFGSFDLEVTVRDRLTMALVAAMAIDAMILIWLAPELGDHWITVGWTVVAFVLAGLGFLWRDRNYRRAGLALFAISLVRATLIDVARAETLYRILAFMCLGLCLVAVSFLYSRWGKKIGRWL